MTTFFTNTKKPSKDKTCFGNYLDHVNYVAHATEDKINRLADLFRHNDESFFDGILQEVSSHMNMFVSLKDGHDYMDEIMGATVLPVASVGVAIVATGYAFSCLCAVALTACGVLERDNYKYQENKDKALILLITALALAIVSLVSFVKSALSLVTRPVVTAFQGWAPQDVERFRNEDSVQSTVQAAFS